MFADEYYKWGHGIVDDLWTTGWQDMKRIIIPVPNFKEQEKIALYLDNKCKTINAVIEKTKVSIEEYKKLKLSVITQAVTKGVRGERQMKDSGIEMIGDIPADWECVLIARIATLVRGGSPRPAGDERYFNGDFIPWITVAEVTNSIGKYIEKTETFLTEEGSKRSRIIEKGTLLLSNSGATLGVPKITNIKGCINDGSVAFYNLEIEKEYLLYVLMSYTDELRKQRQGYGKPNLNTEIIKALSVPLPSDSEQIEIVQYLDGKIIEMDKLISKKEEFLCELESYKKSLIYEYVTGKKEVL
jgi:type I restriction enzyme S subunit